ncbi:hypothetical protein V2J09_017657 [Rumex salicifolius]
MHFSAMLCRAKEWNNDNLSRHVKVDSRDTLQDREREDRDRFRDHESRERLDKSIHGSPRMLKGRLY